MNWLSLRRLVFVEFFFVCVTYRGVFWWQILEHVNFKVRFFVGCPRFQWRGFSSFAKRVVCMTKWKMGWERGKFP